ncbi:MAG: oligopeptidase B, partial [Anaerolineae bacterium]|nr:oligopeptidase B [Anaerolineae bacterium]
MRFKTAILLAALALTSIAFLDGKKMTGQEQLPKPPIANKVPKTTQIHGYTVTDDYTWLADKTKSNPDVLAYLKAEDDYAVAMMKPTTGF